MLVRSTILYTIGTTSSKFLSSILFPILSYYLTVEELGRYDLFLVSISFLVPIVSLQLSSALYRWAITPGGSVRKINEAVTNSLWLLVSCCLLFTGGALLFIDEANDAFGVRYLFMLSVIASVLLGYLQNLARGLSKVGVYSIINTVYALSMLIGSLVGIKFGMPNLEALAAAYLFSNLFCCLLLFFLLRVDSFISFDDLSSRVILEMLIYSIPFIPNMLSWWAMNLSNRFIISHYLGVDQNGIYAMAFRLATSLYLVNSILLMAFQDQILKSTDEKELSKRYKGFVRLVLSLVLVLSAASPFVEYILGEHFHDSWRYIPVLLLSIAFNAFSAYIGIGYQKNKNTNHAMFSSLFSAIFSVLLSIILTKFMGLYGAALSTLLGFVLLFFIRFFHLRHKFAIPSYWYFIGSMSSLVLVVYLVELFAKSLLVNVLLFWFSIIVSCIVNRELIYGVAARMRVSSIKTT